MPVLSRAYVGEGVGGGASGPTVPTPTQVGDVIASIDGVTWETVRPIVSGPDGWLANQDGCLLIEGLVP